MRMTLERIGKRDHGPRGCAKWRTFVYMLSKHTVVQEFKGISRNDDDDDGYLNDGIQATRGLIFLHLFSYVESLGTNANPANQPSSGSTQIVRGGDGISIPWFPLNKFHGLVAPCCCCCPLLGRVAWSMGFRLEACANVLLEAIQNVHGGNLFVSKPKIPNRSNVVGEDSSEVFWINVHALQLLSYPMYLLCPIGPWKRTCFHHDDDDRHRNPFCSVLRL